jgi:DNA-binding response OmpR family regulator
MKNNKINSAKKLILYVEDEEFQAKLFSRIIKSEIGVFDYEIVIFNKGGDFINLLNLRNEDYKIEDFGVILLDMEMHDFSGFDMLKEAQAKFVETPIAILSAIEDESFKEGAFAFGAKDYFVKGKNLQELERLRLFIVENMNSNQ